MCSLGPGTGMRGVGAQEFGGRGCQGSLRQARHDDECGKQAAREERMVHGNSIIAMVAATPWRSLIARATAHSGALKVQP